MSLRHQKQFEITISVILVFMLIPLIITDYMNTITIVTRVLTIIMILQFITLFMLTILKKEFNIFVMICLIFLFWNSFSSYYLANGVLDIVNNARIFTMILLINLSIKRFPASTLNALSFLFGLFIFINFLTFFSLPDGLYLDNPRPNQYRPGWFLGIENQFSVIIIPGFILIVLSSLYNNRKVSFYALLQTVLVLITIIKAWSATAVVTALFVMSSIVLIFKKEFRRFYSFFIMSINYTILWLVLVRLNSFDFFQTMIIDFLGRDMTLSGRTRIWAVIFDIIGESIWYGFGNNTSVLAGVRTYFRAHNMILQSLIDNGIIGLFLFVMCIVIAGVKLQKYKKNQLATLLTIGIFGILVGGLTESYRINYLFLLLTISYNIKFVHEKQPKVT